MALYSKSSQQSINNKPNHSKIFGIVLCCLSAIMIVCLTFSFPVFVSNLIYGIFGLSSYAIFSFLLIVGTSLITNKKLIKNLKYFIFVLCAVVCVLIFLHIILSKNALQTSNFNQYISYCYNFKNTIGGVLLGLISYALFKLLNVVGACVLVAIFLVVFVGLSVDTFLKTDSITVKSQKIRDKIMLNEVERISKRKKLKTEKQPLLNNDEPVINPLQTNQEKQNNILFESNSSVIENTYYKPKTSEERRKYILTPPSMNELYNFSRKTSSKDPYNNTISNSTLPARPSKNPFINEESLQKNREFLKSTYPNYKEKSVNNNNENTFDIQSSKQNSFQFNNESENQTLQTQNLKNESSFDIEEDFVNFKLEELKNNINLNTQPIVPPSSSRASLLNSTINNQSSPTLNNDETEEDYGNIHSVTEPVSISNFTSENNNHTENNRFSNSSNLNSENSYNRFNTDNIDESNNRFSENSSRFSEHNSFDSVNISNNISQSKPKTRKQYIKPPIDLLNTISSNISNDDAECQTNVAILEQTLDDFRIPAKVRQVTKGPAVTRYEIQMPAGISVKKVQQHAEDIAMALSANGKIRIEAPIPGKNAVGIEVPNREIATIGLRDVIDSENFTKATSPLTFALGKDITGEAKICDLRKLTHMLVAGTTGSGKSVCMNTLIVSMMYKSSPEDLRFILIDPKRVEFAVFNGMPHLMLPEVISEPEKALNALSWCIKEMERRYGIIEESRVKNLKEYNETQEVLSGEKPKLPLIVVIVDELCDLMMFNKREVEEKILKLAQKSRAAGIHLVLATQRPSVDVITGTIKGNLPSRIAFAVTSFPDSKTILDCGGAERLLGKGDMLYAPQELPEPVRLQGAFISNNEVEAVVEFIKQNNETDFDEETSHNIVSKQNAKSGGGSYDASEDFDDFFTDALRLVIENGSASGSFIQRRLGIGYNRAGRIIDQMEREKFIAPSDGSNKPRAVYITMEEFERRFNN